MRACVCRHRQAARVQPLQSPKPGGRGRRRAVLRCRAAGAGLMGAVEQLISLPLSAIPFPAFPAVRVTDMDVGLPHAHMHPPNLTPPNPVPVPLPSTGPVPGTRTKSPVAAGTVVRTVTAFSGTG